jgi:hypothetical protein
VKRAQHLAYHPTEDTVAVSVQNSLFIYSK